MKPVRLIVLAVAGITGLCALILTGRDPTPTNLAATPPDEGKFTEVLIAKGEVPIGTMINESNLDWVKWPQDLASSSMIQRSTRPNAQSEFIGSIARQAFLPNEPIREDKLVKGNGSGFLSAILPSGKRAIAINIDSSGSRSAGGFILPNDYVDLIVTFSDPDASQRVSGEILVSRTILTNIRVLAIGQNTQEKNGERVVTGETATLELDPAQVELVTLNQRTGSLSLSLRSLADVNKSEEKRIKPLVQAITVIRYGTSLEVSK